MHTSSLNFLAGITFATSLSAPAFAQHVGDIGIEANAAGRLTTHIVSAGGIEGPERIFSALFGDTGVPNFTGNPGFNALPGTFNPAFRLGFNIRSPLLVWNGDGFSPTDAAGSAFGERVKMSFLTANVTSGTVPVAGFSLAVQPDGGWHRHFSFTLLPATGFTVPDAGIYLLELELWPTDPSLSTSEPFWIVMNFASTTTEYDAAETWAREHLVGSPCPADFDGDRVVNGLDLSIILSNWGGSGSGDINGSGSVDGIDLATVLSAWGPCQ